MEPELIRAMRLEVLPRLGATAEADLWLSPLVRLRGPDGIALRLDVLEVLRADLKLRWQSDGERQLVERAWRVTQRIHRDTSPALVLEERVAWFALTGALGSAEAELDRAVKELEAGTRPGITGWYAQAWSRLPAEVRDTRGAGFSTRRRGGLDRCASARPPSPTTCCLTTFPWPAPGWMTSGLASIEGDLVQAWGLWRIRGGRAAGPRH